MRSWLLLNCPLFSVTLHYLITVETWYLEIVLTNIRCGHVSIGTCCGRSDQLWSAIYIYIYIHLGLYASLYGGVVQATEKLRWQRTDGFWMLLILSVVWCNAPHKYAGSSSPVYWPAAPWTIYRPRTVRQCSTSSYRDSWRKWTRIRSRT